MACAARAHRRVRPALHRPHSAPHVTTTPSCCCTARSATRSAPRARPCPRPIPASASTARPPVEPARPTRPRPVPAAPAACTTSTTRRAFSRAPRGRTRAGPAASPAPPRVKTASDRPRIAPAVFHPAVIGCTTTAASRPAAPLARMPRRRPHARAARRPARPAPADPPASARPASPHCS